MGGGSEEGVVQEVIYLPMAFTVGKAEVPIDQMQGAFGSMDHNQLGAAGFVLLVAQGNVVFLAAGPAAEHQVAVAAVFTRDVHLKEVGSDFEVVGQQFRLIVVARTPDVVIHLLQTDEVRIFFFNHAQDSLEAIATIAAADAFVDIIGE